MINGSIIMILKDNLSEIFCDFSFEIRLEKYKKIIKSPEIIIRK